MAGKSGVIVMVFTALLVTLYVTLRVDAPNYEMKLKRHDSVISNTVEYPYKYRLLNPYITELWHSALSVIFTGKQSFLLAYALQNLVVFLFLFWAVNRYLSLWFDPPAAAAGLLLFALLALVTLTGYDILGDMTTAGMMALGFSFIIRSEIKLLFPLVIIGAFNELQMLLIVPFYFFSSRKNLRDRNSWLNSLLLTAAFTSAYSVIYFIRGGGSGGSDILWFFTKDASFNISNPGWIPLWVLTIIPLLYFALRNFSVKPWFLRMNLMTVVPVFYFIIFFFAARLREMDKALTIFLFLIPLALMSLFPAHVKKEEPAG